MSRDIADAVPKQCEHVPESRVGERNPAYRGLFIMDIKVIRTQTSQHKKLRERNRVLAPSRVRVVVQEIAMWIYSALK